MNKNNTMSDSGKLTKEKGLTPNAELQGPLVARSIRALVESTLHSRLTWV